MTPVGLDLTDTMVGLYTRVQLFEDLGVLDSEGEPLSGMKIRFEDELPGPARITEMAHTVVDECAAAIEPVSAPVSPSIRRIDASTSAPVWFAMKRQASSFFDPRAFTIQTPSIAGTPLAGAALACARTPRSSRSSSS